MDMQSQKIPDDAEDAIRRYADAMERIVEDLKPFYPKAVLLFGSLARWLAGVKCDHIPNDMDLLIVCNNSLYEVEKKNYEVPVQLNLLRVDQIVGIAKSLRYDAKLTALSKLYSKNIAKQHAIDIIAACLLLGPDYNKFGIEQIEIGGLIDKRDYSIHKVLLGESWWNRLRKYATERRGPWKRFFDRLDHADEFF
jgi:hypothetical protein